MAFPFYKQLNTMDCGPTCLRMIARYYGKRFTAETLRQHTSYNRQGVSLLGISEAAEKLGFSTRGVGLSFDQLSKITVPAIIHWNQNHFVVLTAVKKKRVTVADPAKGIISYTHHEFLSHWISSRNNIGEPIGIALILEPTPGFYDQEGENSRRLNWALAGKYLRKSRWQVIQVFIALLISMLFQLIFPFLTQSIVDTGINTNNLQYITIVLIAQLMLTFSRSLVDFIRSRLLLRIANILNLSLLSDFWIKLTRLPLSYFDATQTGDTLQRIGDHRQIQTFLTGSALTTLFSLFNLLIFGVVLVSYNLQIFLVFSAGSILYFLWVRIFLRIRRKLNYQTFHLSAKENNATLQLVQGMQEIKLNNAEQLKRWEWENVQAGIFNLNFKSLTYSQWQQAGALFINQGKDFVITFLVAQLVIQGQLTLGAMLAVQFIIGQLSSPVEQFISFIQSAQDAKISMERLNDVHELEDEEPADRNYLAYLPDSKSIHFTQLSFTYKGAGNNPVLNNIDLEIPEGKITAIVGTSGSGKTTLLKLLLRFYENYEGTIKIGDANFKHISPSFWRKKCGSVLQDGYIFNDTIGRNVAVGDDIPNYEKLIECCKIANILTFVETLPNGFQTRLGAEGVGISQGQRQRILIARAIYKSPQYLFLDEATNSLDANNERSIVEGLHHFFKGRTVIVVAHRLSTVKHADKIVVLHEGRIAEEGTHASLSLMKGRYFELVKNQLELGE